MPEPRATSVDSALWIAPRKPLNEKGYSLRLKDGQDYTVRPLRPADDHTLQAFFYSHTEETIRRRYGFTLTRMTDQRAHELCSVDQINDIALVILQVMDGRDIFHAVGRYYSDSQKRAEMAFVVREDKRRLGMARTLLGEMIAIARLNDLRQVWAQVDGDNLNMLGLFRQFHFSEALVDAQTVTMTLPLTPAK